MLSANHAKYQFIARVHCNSINEKKGLDKIITYCTLRSFVCIQLRNPPYPQHICVSRPVTCSRVNLPISF